MWWLRCCRWWLWRIESITIDTLLLISQPSSYRIAPYLQAAKRLGLEVLIASRGEHSLITEVHQGLHIDLDNLDASFERIIKRSQKTHFAGVLGSDDSTVELAARVAEYLHLPHNPPQAARLTRRKDLARMHLALAGCAVPINCLLDLDKPIQSQMAGLPWPCVLKPLNLSASKGVIRANNEAEFIAACERIRPLILAGSEDEFEQQHILIEDYIDGMEVAFEGYLHQGQLHQLAIFDKPDPLTGPYFEESIYVTPSALSGNDQQRIFDSVQQACKAYGLVTGPVHAELRINDENAWILEVASRTIGGDCGRILDAGQNFNIEELAISLAINQPIDVASPQDARGVMMIPIKQGGLLRRVEGISNAENIPCIDKVDILAQRGHELVPLPEGNQYPGYIFASGQTQQQVVLALKAAFECLDFVVAPSFDLVVE